MFNWNVRSLGVVPLSHSIVGTPIHVSMIPCHNLPMQKNTNSFCMMKKTFVSFTTRHHSALLAIATN